MENSQKVRQKNWNVQNNRANMRKILIIDSLDKLDVKIEGETLTETDIVDEIVEDI